jgi:hypothetical protein
VDAPCVVVVAFGVKGDCEVERSRAGGVFTWAKANELIGNQERASLGPVNASVAFGVYLDVTNAALVNAAGALWCELKA